MKQPVLNIISVYTRTFNNTNRTFNAVGLNTTYYYETVKVIVTKSDSLIFTSSSTIDTYGCLYRLYFNPVNPAENLLTSDDNSGINQQFRFSYSLTPDTYILVIATNISATSIPFWIIVTGRSGVTLE